MTAECAISMLMSVLFSACAFVLPLQYLAKIWTKLWWLNYMRHAVPTVNCRPTYMAIGLPQYCRPTYMKSFNFRYDVVLEISLDKKALLSKYPRHSPN